MRWAIAGDLDAPHGSPVTSTLGPAMEEGDKVLLFYNSANRDEAVFDDPFAFDIRRTPNHHVGFGGPGPHFCLGAHLARREITVMFRELLRRVPDIARHRGARPPPIQLHQRHQAPALRLLVPVPHD